MKRKIMGIGLILLLLGTIPLVAATESTECETTTLGPLQKKTLVVGLITKPQMSITGQALHFRAIALRYMVFGEKRVVNVHGLQKITLPNDFRGTVGNHFVFAVFQGVPR